MTKTDSAPRPEASASPPRLPRNAKGKRPAFFSEPPLEHAMSMIMVLASEFAVMRERIDTIERLAAKRDWNLAEELDAFEPDQDTLDDRERWRQDFAERLYYLMLKEAEEARKGEREEDMLAAIAEFAEGPDPADTARPVPDGR